ncbi:MAG: lipocalin family protein [Bacteroidales bacterium]|nr:lipocalin family protein [Bacteroidales bacterium]
MRKAITFIILCVLTLSCSQNNGHIGPIFGSWSLIEMTSGGHALEIAGNGTVFGFQDEVVQITHILNSYGDFTKNFGNFKIEGTILTLQFEAGLSGDEGYQYTAPYWMHFPEDGTPIRLDIKEIGAKTMIWEYVATNGITYNYKFKKTW